MHHISLDFLFQLCLVFHPAAAHQPIRVKKFIMSFLPIEELHYGTRDIERKNKNSTSCLNTKLMFGSG